MNFKARLKWILISLIIFCFSIFFYNFHNLNQFSASLEKFQNQETLSKHLLELQKLKPIKKSGENLLEIEAKAIVSILIKPAFPTGRNDNLKRILYEKNKERILPIASLSKLMTAQIVLENYNLDKTVKIQKGDVEQTGEIGSYKIGENFKIEDILCSILMESSNDAAWALSQIIGKENFINLMNEKAKEMGLLKTFFVNPTGLPLKNSTSSTSIFSANVSTAQDLAEFGRYLIENDSEVLKISSSKEFDIYTAEKVFHHKILNKNKLLEETNLEIIGGKTGYTKLAKECLFLIIKAPKNQGVIINVILGSKNHFKEMKELIDWLESAYVW